MPLGSDFVEYMDEALERASAISDLRDVVREKLGIAPPKPVFTVAMSKRVRARPVLRPEKVRRFISDWTDLDEWADLVTRSLGDPRARSVAMSTLCQALSEGAAPGETSEGSAQG